MLGWGVQPVNRQVLHIWGGLEHGGAPLVSAPRAVLGAQGAVSVAQRSEDNSGCTAAPLPWAVSLVQYVSSSSHADSQYGLAKGLFTPKCWSQCPPGWLWELSVPCG